MMEQQSVSRLQASTHALMNRRRKMAGAPSRDSGWHRLCSRNIRENQLFRATARNRVFKKGFYRPSPKNYFTFSRLVEFPVTQRKYSNQHILLCSKTCNAKVLPVGRLLELSAFCISNTIITSLIISTHNKLLLHRLSIFSLLCLHQLFPGNGF
jgi:hypothetical protein